MSTNLSPYCSKWDFCIRATRSCLEERIHALLLFQLFVASRVEFNLSLVQSSVNSSLQFGKLVPQTEVIPKHFLLCV